MQSSKPRKRLRSRAAALPAGAWRTSCWCCGSSLTWVLLPCAHSHPLRPAVLGLFPAPSFFRALRPHALPVLPDIFYRPISNGEGSDLCGWCWLLFLKPVVCTPRLALSIWSGEKAGQGISSVAFHKKKSHAALKKESSTGTHSPYKHQNLVPKLFWQLSPDAVLLPMRSASSESPFIIPHCIFNNWTLSAFFQTSSEFGLKMIAARVYLTAETSCLSRGWKVSMQVMLFGSQTLQIKASFPCWSISCLWGSFLF